MHPILIRSGIQFQHLNIIDISDCQQRLGARCHIHKNLIAEIILPAACQLVDFFIFSAQKKQ